MKGESEESKGNAPVKNKSESESKIDDRKKLNQRENNEEDLRAEVEKLRNRVDDLEDRVTELEKLTDDRFGLHISGYFDVSVSNYKNRPNVFQIGTFELDIERNYKENFQVAAALTFNRGAELAVGFIDYHIFGGSISPRGRLFQEKGLHIQVGKFDVPFGNDWQYFAAPKRITVTPPITTEEIMEGGYNDVGLRIIANFVSLNASLFMLRGIEEAYSYGGNSYGGRIGITPFSNPYALKDKKISIMELGASYVIDVDRKGATAEKLYAVDLESKMGPVIVRMEYMNREKVVGIILDGYHITLAFDFQSIMSFPLILYSRYDFYQMTRTEKISDEKKITRMTGGININIGYISYLKFEYIQYLDAYDELEQSEYYSEKLYYLQLMITF